MKETNWEVVANRLYVALLLIRNNSSAYLDDDLFNFISKDFKDNIPGCDPKFSINDEIETSNQ